MALLKRSASYLQSTMLRAVCAVAVIAVVFLPPLSGIDSGNAEERTPTEYSVKLAYLYNFAKVIQWPSGGIPSNDFIIGIVGNNSLALPVDAKKEAGGKRVVVRHVMKPEQLRDCQIVYIPVTERDHLPQLLKAVEGRPVVTVGDFEGFLRGGGMINLVSSKGKIVFDINVAATKKAGVTVGYQLLRLARELI